MTEQTQKLDPAAEASGPGIAPGRVGPPKAQPLLVAVLVAAIILMIAFGAFWTSF